MPGTGGKFNTETVQFLRLLARHRADAVAAITAWVARWSGLLAVAAQRAFTASLLELPPPTDLSNCPGLSCTSSSRKRADKSLLLG